jgi:hypothetical protein
MPEEPQVLTNAAAATHLRSLLTQLPSKPPAAPTQPHPPTAPVAAMSCQAPRRDPVAQVGLGSSAKCGRTISTSAARVADGVTEHAGERVAHPGLVDLRRDRLANHHAPWR